MTQHQRGLRTSRRTWAALVPTAIAATALLTGGLTTPASAAHPSESKASAQCTDDNARVKHGYHGVDPNTLSAHEASRSQKQLQNKLAKMGYTKKKLNKYDTIRIPVRWHIILRDNGTGGVSTARIKEQMKVMNQGFAGATAKAAAKTPFRFTLKKVDRTKNSDWFEWASPDVDPSDDNEAKSALNKNPQTDLNVYVANLGDGLLGYATYPWETDLQQGMVILNESMPGGNAVPYNEGDTATHEVGHWLGLAHTFDNGCTRPGDMVKDTPYQLDGENIFFCNESDDTCPQPGKDPVHNFMSYGDDPCLDQFTKGQSKRMVKQWAVWRGPSPSLS